jgi:hypothetical protein
VTTAWFFVGSVTGGALVGGALGTLGEVALTDGVTLDSPTRIAALGIFALIAVAFDTHMIPWELPGPRRQVNETWLYTYRGWFYGLSFGLQLGAAITTFVTTAAVYVLLVGAFLSGDPLVGALVGGTFGLVRGVTLLPTVRVVTTQALGRQAALIEALDEPSRIATVGAEAAAAIAAALLVCL